MFKNEAARDAIAAKVENAKPFRGQQRRGYKFGTTRNLYEGERKIGFYGSQACVVFSPAGSRSSESFGDRILFFGSNGIIEHEDAMTDENVAWFNAAYSACAVQK